MAIHKPTYLVIMALLTSTLIKTKQTLTIMVMDHLKDPLATVSLTGVVYLARTIRTSSSKPKIATSITSISIE